LLKVYLPCNLKIIVDMWEKLKAFHPSSFDRRELRKRGIVGLFMIMLGMVLLVLTIGSIVTHFSGLSVIPVLAIVGILIIVGLLLLVTELIEGWLSKGQAALVDGLQAG
jgi:hypothetical protein